MGEVVQLHNKDGYSRHRLNRLFNTNRLIILAPVIENATAKDLSCTYEILARLGRAKDRQQRWLDQGHWSYDHNVHGAIVAALEKEWEIARQQEQTIATGKTAGILPQD